MQTHYYARSSANFRGASFLAAASARRLLQAAGMLLVFWLLALPAQAQTAIPIQYNVDQAGKVSLAVYDASGKHVLTMFSARNKLAGTYDTTWNGKDEAGNLVPNPLTCTWKLLRTPGIKATHRVSIGSTFPEGDKDWKVGMGNHLGVRSVAVDSLGQNIYCGAGGSENVRNAIKMPMDGKTVTWNSWQPEAFQGRFSMAVMDGWVFHLQKNGRLGAHPITTGGDINQSVGVGTNIVTKSFQWVAAWNGRLMKKYTETDDLTEYWSEPTAQTMDMAAYNATGKPAQLVVSYRKYNAVVWFDYKTKQGIDTVTLTSPEGVAIDNAGNVLVISGPTVYKYNRTSPGNISKTTFITNLNQPYRLDVDRRNGTVFVAERGNYSATPDAGNQVKQFTVDGNPIATTAGKPVIGTSGGRNYGRYNPNELRDIVDITADNHGGFIIAEGTAPRRLARFNAFGTLIKEWYSGTMWVPGVGIDPDDRTTVWMNITNREIARYKVNYADTSFSIHSIYKFTDVGNGTEVAPDWSKGYDGMGGGNHMWHVRKNAGITYLVRRGRMQVLKLDSIAWQLKLAASGSFGSSAVTLKSDLNNDGTLDDAGETRTFPGVTGSQASDSPSGFTYYRYVNPEGKVYKYEVDTWSNGAPVYKAPSLATVALNVPAFPATTIRALDENKVPVETYYPNGRYYPKGSGVFAQESPNAPLYVTMTANQYDTNDNNLVDDINDYGNASHNKMYRVDAGANLRWGVGRHKKRPNQGMGWHAEFDPDSIFTFKSNIGVARGVVMATDYNGGWDGKTPAIVYAYDSSGLFVGNLFENYVGELRNYTHSTDNGSGAVHYKAGSSIVTYLAGAENEGRLYDLSGWTGWTRESGKVNNKSTAYSINAGGGAAGSFAADAQASGGTVSSVSTTAVDVTGVTAPAPQSVYQSGRHGNFYYTFPSLDPAKSFKVRLHFNETFMTAAGQRTFHVDINGTRKLTGFDVYAAAGANHKAVVREFTVQPNTSGQVVVTFTSVVENAQVRGIEVLEVVTPPGAYAINSGGSAVGDFAADQYASSGFVSSTTSTVSTTGVIDPAPASVYQTHRFNNTFSYTFPALVAGANYKVRLHFAEQTWINDGKRVFHVDINSVRKLTNFDIHAKVGYLKATVEEFVVPANASGQVVIAFSTVTDKASISGIEIIPATPTTVYAINSGGSAVGDFAADQYASSGFVSSTTSTVSTTGVIDPAPASVYQTHRFNNTFSYTFPALVVGANYKVRLHFAEQTWINDGKRVFHVDINSVRKLTSFDIHAKVGYLKATVEEFTVPANASGQIVIAFSTVTDKASISGIEIISNAGARVAAEGMGAAQPTVSLYPNPATNEISVVLPQLAGQDVSLQLLNAKGASVSKTDKKVDASGVVRMGVSQVPSGLYYLQVRHAGGALSGKVVIRK